MKDKGTIAAQRDLRTATVLDRAQRKLTELVATNARSQMTGMIWVGVRMQDGVAKSAPFKIEGADSESDN